MCTFLVALSGLTPAANADTGSVSNVTSLDFGEFAADFSVTRTRCAASGYCGFFPEATTIPAGSSCGSTPTVDIAWVGDVREASGTVSEHEDFYPVSGPFDFCLWVYATGYELVAQIPGSGGSGGNGDPAPGSPGTAAPQHGELIPSTVAHRVDKYHFDSFRVSNILLPLDMELVDFTTMARRVGARWGLQEAGTVDAFPSIYDGYNTVGFSSLVPDGALGVTSIYSKKIYARHKKKCKKVRRHGRLVRKCKKGKRYVKARRVVEEDTALSWDEAWNVKPVYPRPTQYDLETALIHELGHYAGNEHSARCKDSPMAPALATGEFWHGEADWRRAGCAGSLRMNAAPGAKRARFLTRKVTVTGPPRARR